MHAYPFKSRLPRWTLDQVLVKPSFGFASTSQCLLDLAARPGRHLVNGIRDIGGLARASRLFIAGNELVF
jgi:hypothetical protein